MAIDYDRPPILTTLLKLQGVYPSLRTAEKRAADFISLHPEEVVYLSVTDVAERSATSEATVVRMCQHAGFSGFQGLKTALVQDLVAPIKNIHEDVIEQDDPTLVVQKVFNANIQALENTRAILDVAELERATAAILAAKNAAVIGVGTSGPIALDCQYKLMRLGLRCQAFVDPHIQLMLVAQLSRDDVLIGVSHSGSSKEIVEAMTRAKELGIITVCITGYPKSPLSTVSDITLHTSALETKYRSEAIASRVAQLTITDALQVNIALRMKEKALAQIRQTEMLVDVKKY